MGLSEDIPMYRCTYDSSCTFQTLHCTDIMWPAILRVFIKGFPYRKGFIAPKKIVTTGQVRTTM